MVLSRKRNESVIINGNIIVTVVDIRSDKVRIGIEAPAEVPVHRLEVQEAIDREARAKEIQERKQREREGGERGIDRAAGSLGDKLGHYVDGPIVGIGVDDQGGPLLVVYGSRKVLKDAPTHWEGFPVVHHVCGPIRPCSESEGGDQP